LDLLSFIGVDAIPSARTQTYLVSVKTATGEDRYKQISDLAILLPKMPVMPAFMTGWSGVNHLLELHRQASKWTAMPEEQRKKAEWVWKSVLQKDSKSYLAAVAILHEFRDQGKELSPLLWCWWRIDRLIEEGFTGLAFHSIWHPQILKSPKMRRWFYEEVNQEHICRRKVWPAEASKLLDIVREFESRASRLPTGTEHTEMWYHDYSARFSSLLESARFVQDAARSRLEDRAGKFDLGVWLSADPISYLGLSGVRAQLVTPPAPPKFPDTPAKPVLRKRKTKV